MMVESIVSLVADRLTAITKESIRDEEKLLTISVKEVSKLSSELTDIKGVLPEAERLRSREGSVETWLSNLQKACRELEDFLDEWEDAILKLKHKSDSAVVTPCKKEVSSSIPSSCLCFKKLAVARRFSKKFRDVKKKIHDLFEEMKNLSLVTDTNSIVTDTKTQPLQSTSEEEEVYGRDFDRDILVAKLTANGRSQEESGIHILAIVGAWGIGKTTLAQLVYNNSRVKQYFEFMVWVCASGPFDADRIAREIVESVGRGSTCTNNKELEMLKDCVSGKKFLLILDGVCEQDKTKWEPLENSLKVGGVGAKVLVTTRSQKVANNMGAMDDDIHRLRQLSDTDCWSLLWDLSRRKEEERKEFEDVGRRIANKCAGWPPVAKSLGKLLRRKNSLEEWRNVVEKEIWEVEGIAADFYRNLSSTYNELSPAVLKNCFLYCATFSRGLVFEVEKLIESWIALGYLGSTIVGGSDIEVRGREYFDMLAVSFLFEDFKKGDLDGQIKACKMNGIVYEFAQWQRKQTTEGAKETSCQVSDPPVAVTVEECSLFLSDERHTCLSDSLELASLRVLGIRCGLRSMPRGTEKLIRLRWLDLSDMKVSKDDTRLICKLGNLQFLSFNAGEIPREIENLIHLRHLDLSFSGSLLELPESICSLQELRTLDVNFCPSLSRLPQEIRRLKNLKHLCNSGTGCLKQYPQGLAQLSGLRTLSEYRGGSGSSKLGWLKDLNHLTGSLTLSIKFATGDDSEGVVEDAKEAKMSLKEQIDELIIKFEDEKDEERESVRMKRVIDALEPHPNLQKLHIWFYNGSELPAWTASLNQLREVHLYRFNHLSSLPLLGKLPCLEEIYVSEMGGLRSVGQEFLGPTASSSSKVRFPKLKELTFNHCPKWEEWEDITAEEEEEEDSAVPIMPCLMKLNVIACHRLTALPYRLLQKASSLKQLNISCSTRLQQSDLRDKAWKFQLIL